jgi:hypothetical protein
MAMSCRLHAPSSSFQWLHELIWGEEKLAQVFVQHSLAHVLPGMRFLKRNNIRDASGVSDRSLNQVKSVTRDEDVLWGMQT